MLLININLINKVWGDKVKSKFNLRNIVLIGLLIAISAIGSNIKILNSIAFDSMPAYLTAILIGPISAAIVAIFGHLLTALTSGFPLSLPVHIIVSFTMAMTMLATSFVFKLFRKSNFFIAAAISILVGTLFNGPISCLALLPLLGKTVFVLMPILSGVSALNVLIALIVYYFLPKKVKEEFNSMESI